MNTTRRLFSRWLGAAPLAIGAVAASPRGVAETTSLNINGVGAKSIHDLKSYIKESIPDPVGVSQYWNARAELHRTNNYKNLLSTARREMHNVGFPPTIDCLKSVSNVHKYHMMVQRRLKHEEDEKTFTEMLMDKFGVREWFQKQNPHGDGAKVEYTGSSGGY